MRKTEPKVYLLARPQIDFEQMFNFLESQKGQAWADRVASAGIPVNDGELLVEFMGRLCYKSWEPGLNPNVTKVRNDSTEYLENILKSQHGSVIEHAQYSFVFENVSRVFTHELVRHRVGDAFSQESLRYVRLVDIGFRIPEVLSELEPEIISIVERLEEFQREAAKKLKLDEDGVPFHVKKEATSALRRLAPIGLSTNIGWSANLRTLRFVIEKRTAVGAEEEMRTVFREVARIMRDECPALMGDLLPNSDDEIVPRWSKV